MMHHRNQLELIEIDRPATNLKLKLGNEQNMSHKHNYRCYIAKAN